MNIEELSDTELIARHKAIVAMHDNRHAKLNDLTHLERLKSRKINRASMLDHVNPEYQALRDRVEAEVKKRNLSNQPSKIDWSNHWS